MPGATLPNMSIVLPSLGGDSGIWDDEINAALTLLDAHNHTSGKGPRVPVAGLNIDADIAFGGNGATGLGLAAFNARAALTTGARTLFVSSSDNELYWRTNGGTNVKLTSGTSINTTLVGGIVGDYAAVGAEVAYDDAGDRYTFKQQGGGGSKPWARIACGGLRLFEFNTTESVYTAILANSALASSYDITLPAALPGAQRFVVIDATGAMAFTNTISGATAFASTVSAGGTLTAGNGLTVSTGTVDLSGATALKLPSRAKSIFPSSGTQNSGTGAYAGQKWTHAGAASIAHFPVELHVGDRITAIDINFSRDSGSSISFELYEVSSTGTPTQLVIKSNNTTVGNGSISLGVSPSGGSLPRTIEANKTYFITFNGGNGDDLYGIHITYDRP